MPRANELVPSTHMVRRKRSRASTSSLSARALPWPNAFRVARPWIEFEKFRSEARVTSLAILRVAHIPSVPERGGEQRQQRETQHHQRHRQVDERDDAEDQQRREQRDQELRQELAEIGLELLDAVDHGKRDRARALAADGGGAEARDLVVEDTAQALLYARGRFVGSDRTPVLGRAAQHHDQRDQPDRQSQVRGALACEDLPDQPAQQTEAGDAKADRQKTDCDGRRDAAADTPGEDEKTRFDVHEVNLGRTFLAVSTQFGNFPVHI